MNDRAARVQVDGPLARYAGGFRAELAARGYASSSAAGLLQLMAQVSRWLDVQGLNGHDLRPGVVQEFLEARRAAGYRRWLSSRSLRPLLDHLRGFGVAPAVAVDPLAPVLAAYRAYLVEERGLAASTVRNYLDVARRFVSRVDEPDRTLRDLTGAEVSQFVLAECRARNVGSATIVVVAMRALLRYLHLAGITSTGLAGAVPPAASWPASALPQPIDRRQAALLLSSCDRRTAVGRRDFAVLTLLLRLGLRVGEVAALELDDVDWRHGEILIRGKGRRAERCRCRSTSGKRWPPGCGTAGRAAPRLGCSPRCSPHDKACPAKESQQSCSGRRTDPVW
jgi:integrase/recombinase XerD